MYMYLFIHSTAYGHWVVSTLELFLYSAEMNILCVFW